MSTVHSELYIGEMCICMPSVNSALPSFFSVQQILTLHVTTEAIHPPSQKL